MHYLETLFEFEDFYDKLLPAQVKSREAFAWFSGIPHPLFNAVMHLRHDLDLKEHIEAFLSLAPYKTPVSFWTHGQPKLAASLQEIGFKNSMRCPLVSWSVAKVDAPEHTIKSAELEIFHSILATAFHFDSEVKEGFAQLLKKGAAENYTVHLENHPVGTGTLFAIGKKGGIFNIATLPEFRKRGCATSMIRFLMGRAKQLDLEKVLLLSSSEAAPLYSKLNFKKCLDIDIYTR